MIRNGEKTSVWIDRWVFDGKSRRALALNSLMNINLKVQHLIDPNTRNWHWNRLKELFPQEEVELISRQRPLVSTEDSFRWAHTRNGLYTVKSGYDLCSRTTHNKLFREAEARPSLSPLFEKI